MKFHSVSHTPWFPVTYVITDDNKQQVGVITNDNRPWEAPTFRVYGHTDVSLSAADLEQIAARVSAEDERMKRFKEHQQERYGPHIEVPWGEGEVAISFEEKGDWMRLHTWRKALTGEKYYENYTVTLETLYGIGKADYTLPIFRWQKLRVPLVNNGAPKLETK